MIDPRRATTALFALSLALGISLPAQGDTPPNGNWQPMPDFWDEFNGDKLDASRWETRSPYYPGKPPGLYQPQNVTLDKGMLQLWVKPETVANAPSGYHSFTTAYLTTRKTVLYGYFEVRAKPVKARINSGFWFYRWTETGTYEIDVFEIGGTAPKHENVVHTNTHVFKGNPEHENDQNRRSDPQGWSAGNMMLADDFHIYGLEWDEHELRYYFDNALIRRKPNTSWHVPMHLRFSTETHPNWFGLPRSGEVPAAFLVDYVRAWRKVPGGDEKPVGKP